MNKHLSSVALALAMAATSGAALAQENDETLVVTVTRAAGGVEIKQSGSSITVIDAASMRDRQIRYVHDALRDVPGVSVSQGGARGAFTQVRLRGAEANQTLVLIDGIEAADPFFGEFDFGTLVADEAAKIEIVRGAQSALYGSDAIAGVINYVTLTGREAPGVSARIEGGSFNTYNAAARFAGVAGALDYAITGTYETTDGFPTATVGTLEQGSEQQGYAVRLGLTPADNIAFRAIVRYSATEADLNDQPFPDYLVVDSLGTYYEANSLYALLGADLSLLDGRWTHGLTVQNTLAQRDSYTANARTGGDEGERVKASYVTTYHIDAGGVTHALTGAADWERESYQNTAPSSPFGPDTTERHIDNTGVVAQYDLLFGDAGGFGAALRHDWNDRFEDATTYRVNGFFRPVEWVRLRAAAGSGIKSPGQTDLFGYNAGAFPFIGNPDLKPERSEGWEAGADLYFSGDRARIGITYFEATLKDEIYSIFPLVGPSTTGNRTTDSEQQGVEVSAHAELGAWFSMDASYTYLDAIEAGLEEIRRPPHVASVVVNWAAPNDRFGLNLAARYNGKTFDDDFALFGANEVQLDAFTLVTLGGHFKLTERLELFGRVENALDEDYVELYRYRTAGRAGYVGLRADF